jgi:glycosyltransferase involved in cell wall biosynthesis
MVLLKAVRKIKKIIPDIDLHIVGAVRKEKYFRELKKYVHDNDLEQNVAFLGPLSGAEVKKEYSECSIFVLPSEEESLGLVLVEAMAAGKPVIASNIGGIPYVVINNETGYLLEYGNADELAERIISLTKDDKYRTEMGRKGIKRANDFRNEEITKKVHNFYLSISKT